jgi:hypothetical protein
MVLVLLLLRHPHLPLALLRTVTSKKFRAAGWRSLLPLYPHRENNHLPWIILQNVFLYAWVLWCRLGTENLFLNWNYNCNMKKIMLLKLHYLFLLTIYLFMWVLHTAYWLGGAFCLSVFRTILVLKVTVLYKFWHSFIHSFRKYILSTCVCQALYQDLRIVKKK